MLSHLIVRFSVEMNRLYRGHDFRPVAGMPKEIAGSDVGLGIELGYRPYLPSISSQVTKN